MEKQTNVNETKNGVVNGVDESMIIGLIEKFENEDDEEYRPLRFTNVIDKAMTMENMSVGLKQKLINFIKPEYVYLYHLRELLSSEDRENIEDEFVDFYISLFSSLCPTDQEIKKKFEDFYDQSIKELNRSLRRGDECYLSLASKFYLELGIKYEKVLKKQIEEIFLDDWSEHKLDGYLYFIGLYWSEIVDRKVVRKAFLSLRENEWRYWAGLNWENITNRDRAIIFHRMSTISKWFYYAARDWPEMGKYTYKRAASRISLKDDVKYFWSIVPCS